MNAARAAAVLLVALGMASVSIALGLLYQDYTRREGAWVDLQSRRGQVSDEERAAILEAWKGTDNFASALVAGTAGVAALGAGVLLVVFELPIMRRRQSP